MLLTFSRGRLQELPDLLQASCSIPSYGKIQICPARSDPSHRAQAWLPGCKFSWWTRYSLDPYSLKDYSSFPLHAFPPLCVHASSGSFAKRKYPVEAGQHAGGQGGLWGRGETFAVILILLVFLTWVIKVIKGEINLFFLTPLQLQRSPDHEEAHEHLMKANELEELQEDAHAAYHQGDYSATINILERAIEVRDVTLLQCAKIFWSMCFCLKKKEKKWNLNFDKSELTHFWQKHFSPWWCEDIKEDGRLSLLLKKD